MANNGKQYNYTILLDGGHGIETLKTGSKCSPLVKGVIDIDNFNSDYIIDGKFREYKFARRLNEDASHIFKTMGINVVLVTPEEKDISLSERVNRINKYCKEWPNPVMISTHVNAAGNGGWMSGRGWSVWTTRGQNVSDKLAECLYDAADNYLAKDPMFLESFSGETKQKMIRMDKTDGDRDYESNFQIIKGANCPAVLVENLFMDNKLDLELLCDRHCFYRLVSVLVFGVNNYFKKYKGKDK